MKREILTGIFTKGPFTFVVKVEDGLLIDASFESDLPLYDDDHKLVAVPCSDLVAVLDEAMDFMAARCKTKADQAVFDPDTYLKRETPDTLPCEIEKHTFQAPYEG